MRSKKYKKIITIAGVVLVLLLASAYFVGLQTKNNSVKLQESFENTAEKNSQADLLKKESAENFGQDNQNTENNLNQKNNEEQVKQDQIKKEAENLINVSLKVQDKNYTAKIKEGSSAYELMNQLKQDGLTFSATEYSGLGFFITEINGVKEDRKKSNYWTLYINGKESSVGASQLILKEGDLIEWTNENRKNY